MKGFYRSLVVVAVSMFACSAMADDLIITSAKSIKNNTHSLDIVNSGQAVAFQFEMILPKGLSPKQVDLTQCLSELPRTHHGSCSITAGKIIGFAYSDSNKALPAGMVPVGRVVINGTSKARNSGALKISQFLLSDANAQPIETSVIGDGVIAK